jgi:hypothetical protein
VCGEWGGLGLTAYEGGFSCCWWIGGRGAAYPTEYERKDRSRCYRHFIINKRQQPHREAVALADGHPDVLEEVGDLHRHGRPAHERRVQAPAQRRLLVWVELGIPTIRGRPICPSSVTRLAGAPRTPHPTPPYTHTHHTHPSACLPAHPYLDLAHSLSPPPLDHTHHTHIYIHRTDTHNTHQPHTHVRTLNLERTTLSKIECCRPNSKPGSCPACCCFVFLS